MPIQSLRQEMNGTSFLHVKPNNKPSGQPFGFISNHPPLEKYKSQVGMVYFVYLSIPILDPQTEYPSLLQDDQILLHTIVDLN